MRGLASSAVLGPGAVVVELRLPGGGGGGGGNVCAALDVGPATLRLSAGGGGGGGTSVTGREFSEVSRRSRGALVGQIFTEGGTTVLPCLLIWEVI